MCSYKLYASRLKHQNLLNKRKSLNCYKLAWQPFVTLITIQSMFKFRFIYFDSSNEANKHHSINKEFHLEYFCNTFQLKIAMATFIDGSNLLLGECEGFRILIWYLFLALVDNFISSYFSRQVQLKFEED